MHRLQKIFASSSEGRRSDSDSVSSGSSSSSRRAAGSKPRLERHNARKNIDYCYSPSSGSAPSSSSSSYYTASEESLRTRSLDLYGGRRSFRVEGVDGEIEIMCKNLGFSGVDDFSISPDEYEVMKVRSSSAPVRFSQPIEKGIRDFRDKANVFGSAMVDTGVRPPFLGLLAPPPFMSLPVIDQDCSTWDIFRNFGPDDGRLQVLDEQGRSDRTEDAGEEDKRRRRMAREENFVLSAPCSFTASSNDDDSSSTTTDPVSSVSPNGDLDVLFHLGRRVISWAVDHLDLCMRELLRGEGKQRVAQLEQEIALLRKFKHENIVQYYGTEKDDSHLYIFLELVVKGSLLSLYQKYTLRDSVVSAYTRQILHGLKYLHDQGVVHRFGLAKATKLNDVKSCKGTAFWMAPEVVRSQGYGLAADIWSLGCTVLEMLTRRFPYGDMECMPAMYRIGKGERPPIPDSLSSDARDFLLKCLQADPNVRSTAAELLNHPFVKRPLPVPLGFASSNPFTG
ncbi:hypothetical protein SASPL_156264 [Salvia splendens]|uniref:Protein kinase domain-containing protein n=1 Tax=Salvia splendens TaxID=180675 RepID=A0A8X8YWA4_SALSN|nr:hypothetical protein SASPL_156264 [Salvia splendens]